VTRLLPLVIAIALAAGSGFLVAKAVGGSSQTPVKTVTVDVGTGAQGVQGPQGVPGPPGPPGEFSCIAGYVPGILLINAPGGQVRVYTCVEK